MSQCLACYVVYRGEMLIDEANLFFDYFFFSFRLVEFYFASGLQELRVALYPLAYGINRYAYFLGRLLVVVVVFTED